SVNSFESKSSNEGVIRVYAAYECGAPKGTSVKIQVSRETTAKEVVELVIKQFNAIVKLKNLRAPIYDRDQWDNFILVVAYDGEETLIPDDFNLMKLDEPWKKGRFYVKQKSSESY
ncbi:hypothetical protein B4U79_01189, partial [Dinothrombium tinctorium]